MHALVKELCERHRPAMLLVTHDVDEAIRLADRVLVLSDGVISLDVRTAGQPEDALRQRLLDELGVQLGFGHVPAPDDDPLDPNPDLHLDPSLDPALVKEPLP